MRVRKCNRRDSQANSHPASESVSSVLNPGNLCWGSSMTRVCYDNSHFPTKTRGCPCIETALTKGIILNTSAMIIFYSNCRKCTSSPYLELVLFNSKSKINICAFYLDSLQWQQKDSGLAPTVQQQEPFAQFNHTDIHEKLMQFSSQDMAWHANTYSVFQTPTWCYKPVENVFQRNLFIFTNENSRDNLMSLKINGEKECTLFYTCLPLVWHFITWFWSFEAQAMKLDIHVITSFWNF